MVLDSDVPRPRLNAKAEAARWSVFLNEVMEGDQERIGFFQEWFGYSLIFDTSQQKFVLVEGEGANGKSVMLDVLTAMLRIREREPCSPGILR